MSSPVWIPDHAAKRCHRCNVPFSLFVRRHHCRLCGHIFCHACSSRSVRVGPDEENSIASTPDQVTRRGGGSAAQFFTSWFRTNDDATTDADDASTADRPRRCCDACYTQRQTLRTHGRLVDVFLLVAETTLHADDPMEAWRRMGHVCRAWRAAAQTLLAKFEALRQSRPYMRLHTMQRRVLRVNLRRLAHRSTWVLLAHAQQIPVPPDVLRRTAGDADAGLPPVVRDALLFLMSGDAAASQRVLCRAHATSDDDVDSIAPLRCLVNTLAAHLHAGISRESGDAFLLSLSVASAPASVDVAHRLAFALRARDPDRFGTLMLRADPQLQREWARTTALILVLDRVAREQRIDRVARETWVGARAPWDASLRVTNILTDALTTKTSSSRPTVIPCECRRDSDGHVFVQCLLFKHESVLPDAMVQECVRVYGALNGEDHREAAVVYDVYPVTADTGIVVMLMGCRSLYSLWNDGLSIQNYIMEESPEASVGAIRQRFSESCAFNSVLSLLVGAGDRHLDNLLIHRGRVFGVDYAYLWNQEPNLGKALLSNELRITRSMIDAMGGDTSYYFSHFKMAARDIFRGFRRWHVVFYYVMRALSRDGVHDEAVIRRKIDHTWLPGAGCDAHADLVIEERIRRESRGDDHLFHGISDLFHHYFRRS